MSIPIVIAQTDLAFLALAGAIVTGLLTISRLRGQRLLSARIITDAPRGSRPDFTVSLVLALAAASIALSPSAEWLFSLFQREIELDSFKWWEFADIILAAGAVLLIVLALLVFHRREPRQAVPPRYPRTWRTFLSPKQLWLPAGVLVAILALVLFAGSVSSPDEDGIYRWLTIESGSGYRAAMTFFGWAYGIPVAGVAVLVAVLTVAALHANATRPFLSPETVTREQASRRAISSMLLWFSTGAILLVLGRAMISVGAAGRGTMNSPDYIWGTSIAALDPWFSWLGILAKVAAYTLLVLVIAIRALRAKHPTIVNVPSDEEPAASSRG
jgi:hypothetical protein